MATKTDFRQHYSGFDRTPLSGFDRTTTAHDQDTPGSR
jgi:hypothetical protein